VADEQVVASVVRSYNLIPTCGVTTPRDTKTEDGTGAEFVSDPSVSATLL
jgi:hypothetical protein